MTRILIVLTLLLLPLVAGAQHAPGTYDRARLAIMSKPAATRSDSHWTPAGTTYIIDTIYKDTLDWLKKKYPRDRLDSLEVRLDSLEKRLARAHVVAVSDSGLVKSVSGVTLEPGDGSILPGTETWEIKMGHWTRYEISFDPEG